MPKKSAAAPNAPAEKAGNPTDSGHPVGVSQPTPTTPPPPSPEDAPPAGANASGAVPEIAAADVIPPALEMARPLTLTITSKREGFRRAGRAWSVAPTRVDAAEFTPEQLNALVLEPMLTVTESHLPQAGEG